MFYLSSGEGSSAPHAASSNRGAIKEYNKNNNIIHNGSSSNSSSSSISTEHTSAPFRLNAWRFVNYSSCCSIITDLPSSRPAAGNIRQAPPTAGPRTGGREMWEE
ncbi:hypothetical protein RRG08_044309 [Elysia crispata]|uniref:Uncharacterized protein n=1 Tax=Elysia crispata TaxID=231223 RepID=A0AAE0XY55_9GAST|nr:hypothetical protein RRG08_044309 [Elysia crispata]